LFTILVLMALTTTFVTPMLLRHAYNSMGEPELEAPAEILSGSER